MNKKSGGTTVAAASQVRSRRQRWSSWLSLSLVGALLTFAGLVACSGGLPEIETLPKLNRLDIEGCGLSFEDLDDFQAACPSAKLDRIQ
jgi:hypothetical protein